MGQTWTSRTTARHEAIRKQLGATPSDFCKWTLDAFCKEAILREDRLLKLCGSVRAGRDGSKKEGFGLRRSQRERLPLILPS